MGLHGDLGAHLLSAQVHVSDGLFRLRIYTKLNKRNTMPPLDYVPLFHILMRLL